jgi:hypothetical protein
MSSLWQTAALLSMLQTNLFNMKDLIGIWER